MNRGKSFGEKKKPGDPPMELKADAEVKVTAGLSIDAGLAVGVPYIANASVALSTELGAELGATLAASTALEEENEKLVQGEDLEISGEIKAAFSAALSLVGDVKVLIWKQQVFKLELLKKEIELAFSGTAAKAKNTPGIKEGWNFKEFGFSADVFGKKVIAAIKEKDAAQPTLQEDLKVSKEAAENISGEAQNAWAVLQELKEKRELSKDRAYIITEDEQKKLDEQIHDMTESVLDKMKAYERALIQYRALSQRNEDQAQKDVENARKEQYEYMEKDAVRQITMRNTQAGGFDFKNYHPEKIEEGASNKEKKAAENSNADKRKMASIDFAAARTLGIYHNAVAQARDEYDTFAQVQNLKIDAENKEIEKRNRKAEVETPLKKKYQLSDEMKDHEFLFKEHRFWGTGAQRAQDFSHFGAYNENYFNALYRFAVTANSGKTYKGFGKKYREIFRTRDPVSGKIGYNLSLQGVDVLRCILTDRYPKGACDEKGNPCEDEKIGGTAQDKLEAFKYLFNGKETENRIDQFARLATAQRSLPTQQEEMLQDVNQVYSALFDSNLDDMTKTGSVDLSQSLDKLDENLKRSKEKYLEAVQVHIDAKEAVERITGELVHCKRRMLQLEADVKTATKLKGNAAAGAIAAVNFVEKDYRDIAEGKAARAAVTKDVKNPGEFEVMRKKVFGK